MLYPRGTSFCAPNSFKFILFSASTGILCESILKIRIFNFNNIHNFISSWWGCSLPNTPMNYPVTSFHSSFSKWPPNIWNHTKFSLSYRMYKLNIFQIMINYPKTRNWKRGGLLEGISYCHQNRVENPRGFSFAFDLSPAAAREQSASNSHAFLGFSQLASAAVIHKQSFLLGP